jgi:hypothetical protein
MRLATLLAVSALAALLSASVCEAQRRSPSPLGLRAAEAPLLLGTAHNPPAHYEAPIVRPPSWKRHVAVGMAVGGAAGLAWGIIEASDGENVFGLSPVIETAIGIGVGGYAGTALYLARSIRR